MGRMVHQNEDHVENVAMWAECGVWLHFFEWKNLPRRRFLCRTWWAFHGAVGGVVEPLVGEAEPLVGEDGEAEPLVGEVHHHFQCCCHDHDYYY